MSRGLPSTPHYLLLKNFCMTYDAITHLSMDKSDPCAQIAVMANGKGSLRRPGVIPEDELGARWFAAFGNQRCPLNPAVARSEIAAAEGAEASPSEFADEATCKRCGEPNNVANRCHRASWQKNAGPRRK